MVWQRRGRCNRCGECCKTEMRVSWMLDPETGFCRYLAKKRGKWTCLITGGRFEDRPDTRPEDIPEAHWQYYLAECVPYPRADRTVAKGHPLPPDCGFTFEEV